MGIAGQFFAKRDSNRRLHISSAGALWEWVKTGAADRLVSHKWQLTPGEDLFFRGQPNVEYGLSSSLYRVCRDRRTAPEAGAPNRVDEWVMAQTEREIIEAMRGEGIGRLMTDGQLLAVLQHHGIPTRLIDVSESPLEALFFAVDQEHGVAGRLFMLHLHQDAAQQADTIDFSKESLEWADAAHGQMQAKGEWTQRVAVVAQAPLDPRMQAQRGRFLVGGLNRRYGGRSYWVDGVNVPAGQYPDISTLGVNFLKSTTAKANTHWPATGWTVCIDASWKPDLLQRLAGEGIHHDSMYPPFSEVRRLAMKVARDTVDRHLK
ncbi:FRG domain-containing protein [Streptomyces youssoufiensis]